MVSTLTVTLQEEAIVRTSYTRTWESVLAQVLRGATTKTASGNTTLFSDAFTGMEVEITSSGGFASGFTVKGPVGSVSKTLIDADFETGTVTQKEVVDAFTSYLDTSGASTKLDQLLDNLRYDVTVVGNVTQPIPIYHSTIAGTRHDDIFRLNDSPNTVYASAGEDEYFGGSSFDTVSYSFVSGGLKMTKSGALRLIEKSNGDIDTLKNIDSLHGTDANDNFRVGLGGMAQQIYGAGGNDKIGGGSKGDHLDGGAGNDTVLGRGGNDLLFGGDGDDFLNGGGGNDILFGGNGYGGYNAESNDMKGGSGKDLFVLEALTYSFGGGENFVRIRDFRDGTDFIGLIGEDFSIYGSDADNLVFSDLAIKDTAKGAMISYNGNDLALLNNVLAADLTREDFVELVNPYDFAGYYDEFLYL